MGAAAAANSGLKALPHRARRAPTDYSCSVRIPLFPLNTVLFPGGPLPLRIFEPRYLDMISRCMKEETPFGVLLIKEGHEVGPATTHSIGTMANVIDWYQGSDGLLGITAIGTERFRLVDADQEEDGLNIGKVEVMPPPPSMQLPDEYQALPPILDSVMDDLGRLYENLGREGNDAVWVAHRFLEILPIGLEQKQLWLESDDILGCLKMIDTTLHN